jgi:hypothetical protein
MYLLQTNWGKEKGLGCKKQKTVVTSQYGSSTEHF